MGFLDDAKKKLGEAVESAKEFIRIMVRSYFLFKKIYSSLIKSRRKKNRIKILIGEKKL